VESLRSAWDAAMAGIPLDRAAAENSALAAAIRRYGA
jgi:ribulose 1,5-bisphosphate carboxylase large subunit-like protein